MGEEEGATAGAKNENARLPRWSLPCAAGPTLTGAAAWSSIASPAADQSQWPGDGGAFGEEGARLWVCRERASALFVSEEARAVWLYAIDR